MQLSAWGCNIIKAFPGVSLGKHFSNIDNQFIKIQILVQHAHPLAALNPAVVDVIQISTGFKMKVKHFKTRVYNLYVF